jgi:DNA-binding SARP family transcriptional activator/predicted ATPase
LHSRETLAGLLWGDLPEANARRNLTKSLTVLRRHFNPFLTIENQYVGLRIDTGFRVDTLDLDALSAEDNEETISLAQAAKQYRGEFLSGFYVKASPAFDEWVVTCRERYRELVIGILEKLINRATEGGRFKEGIEYARRLLSLDPWREAAHRQLMVLLASDGQRSTALAQYEKLCHILDEELGIEPAPETHTLYARLLNLDASIPHNLPPEPGLFVGRAAEQAYIVRQLNDPTCCLVSLVGPGGIGKTRLALQIARQFAGSAYLLDGADFRDGIYFIDLAAEYLNPENVLPEGIANAMATAMAEAMQYRLPNDRQPLQQLLAYLARLHVLLVIDNFEDWLAGAHYLTALLRQAPGVKLLVTSRERLNLSQEWVVNVDGLAYPPAGDLYVESPTQPAVPEAPPLPADAVTLFIHHARRYRSDFEPGEEELSQVIRICQLVEGSPLALELAAGWLPLLTTEEILDEIRRSFDFLNANTRDLPARHRSLRAVFDPSWQMLEPAEQEALRRLSVFQGGFDRKSAQAVTGASLVQLAGLVNKSWLRVSDAGRYRLHELVRQYAGEKLLAAADEMIAARDRHSRVYASFVRRLIPHLYSSALPDAIASLTEEIGNIRVGWRWAAIAEHDAVFEDIADYVRGLRLFYGRRGLFHEGLEMCRAFIRRVEDSSTADEGLLGQLKLWEGLFHNYLGDLPAAADCLRRSQDLLSQQPSEAPYAVKDLAGAHHLSGMVERRRGNYRAARLAFAEAERLDASLGDHGYAAKSAVFSGVLHLDAGDYAEAQSRLQRCLPVLRENRDYYYTSLALGALARVLALTGQPLTEVIELLQRNLEGSRAAKLAYAEASSLAHLGLSLSLQPEARLSEAKDLLEESLHKYALIQAPLEALRARYWLAGVHLKSGQIPEAGRTYRRCVRTAYEHGFTILAIDGLVGLAEVALQPEAAHWPREQVDAILALARSQPATRAPTRAAAERLAAGAAGMREATLEQIVEQIGRMTVEARDW